MAGDILVTNTVVRAAGTVFAFPKPQPLEPGRTGAMSVWRLLRGPLASV